MQTQTNTLSLNYFHVAQQIFIVGVLGLLAFVLLAPASALAHRFVDQSAVQVTDTMFLFTLDFQFGFLNRDAKLPLRARMVTEAGDPEQHFQYRLVDENGDPVPVLASSAAVIGKPPVKNGTYDIPENTPDTYKLVSVVQISDAAAKTGGSLQLELLTMPYWLKQSENIYRLGSISRDLLGAHKTDLVRWSPSPTLATTNTTTTNTNGSTFTISKK